MTDQAIVIGGVIKNWSAEYLHEDTFEGTNLDYEVHLTECPNEDHDGCWENLGSETWLIGFIECEPDDKKVCYAEVGEHGSFGFKLDPEAEYSAIVGEIYTQVLSSKWMADCRMCSPCYPSQGDLDTPGDFPTYSLPPDIYGDNEPAVKIVPAKRENSYISLSELCGPALPYQAPDPAVDLKAFWDPKTWEG